MPFDMQGDIEVLERLFAHARCSRWIPCDVKSVVAG